MRLKNKVQQTVISVDNTKVLQGYCEVSNVNLRKSGVMTGTVNNIGRVQLLMTGVWQPMEEK